MIVAAHSLPGWRKAIEGIIHLHYFEVGQQDHGLVNPDWEAYDASQQQGLMSLLTVMNEQGVSGYAAVYHDTATHCRNEVHAHVDVFFVLPSARGTRATKKLMEACRWVARDRKAKSLTWGAKPNTDMDKMLRKRITHHENLYMEVI